MFKRAVKVKEELAKNPTEEQVQQDFVTRNMPDFSRLSSQTFASSVNTPSANKGKIDIPKKENHQKVGVVIIILGIIFVLVLIYLGYLYFIKPNLASPESEVIYTQETVEQNNEESKAGEVILEDKNINTEEPIIVTTTPEILEEDEELVMPEELPIVSNVITVSKVDSDADGLTDDEETIIGTDLNRADTDGDGYLDLAEIKSGYNPLVPAEKLSESAAIYNYQIDSLATVIYPTSWEVVENESNNMVMFADDDRAFIQILYQENPQKLTPNSWFADQFAGLKPGESISGDSWEGFFSQDGLSAYIFNKDFSKVYNFSCSPLTEDTSSIIIFNLMLKTLIIK